VCRRAKIGSISLSSKTNYFYLVMGWPVWPRWWPRTLCGPKAGRAFIAIRDNDLAAEVMGGESLELQAAGILIVVVYCGSAGSLLIHYYSFASTDGSFLYGFRLYLGMLIVAYGSTTGLF